MGFRSGSDIKRICLQCRQPALILGSKLEGRFLGEGNGYPLLYSCLGNPIDREAWLAAVQREAESDMTEQLTHRWRKKKRRSKRKEEKSKSMS